MSTQLNNYLAHGILLPYKDAKTMLELKFGGDYDDVVSEYEDSAFKGIQHKDGLCVINDGMSGEYWFVGRVLYKTENFQGFDHPIEVSSVDTTMSDLTKALIKTIFGIEGEMKTYVISHYR